MSKGQSRRNMMLGGVAIAAGTAGGAQVAQAQTRPASPSPARTATGAGGQQRPNILFIMGDDVGWFNIGAYHRGMMAGRRRTSTGSPPRA